MEQDPEQHIQKWNFTHKVLKNWNTIDHYGEEDRTPQHREDQFFLYQKKGNWRSLAALNSMDDSQAIPREADTSLPETASTKA